MSDLYLDLLKCILINTIYEDPEVGGSYDASRRTSGKDWPLTAHTMVGRKRLDNLQYCVETILADDIPGDLVETGVWRGGASIFMRAVLKAHNDETRVVWLADSFQGLPPSNNVNDHPLDQVLVLDHYNGYLGVSLAKVQENFTRYNLLDDQVQFIVGWFNETLPTAPMNQISVLRLDGDLYKSTMDALTNLYPKVARGGFIIIDDYEIPACAKAVSDYRMSNDIYEELMPIDENSVFWRRKG